MVVVIFIGRSAGRVVVFDGALVVRLQCDDECDKGGWVERLMSFGALRLQCDDALSEMIFKGKLTKIPSCA